MSDANNPHGWPGAMSSADSQNQPRSVRLPADRTRYSQSVYLRGEDLFVPLCVATAFGGPQDRGDNGLTASGIRTNGVGGVVGCALPMPAARACRGTPFPQLPWKTPVHFTYVGRTVVIPLIDDGPAGGLSSRAFVDITLEGWELLLGTKLAASQVNDLCKLVMFIVPGVARFLKDYRPWGVTGCDEGQA